MLKLSSYKEKALGLRISYLQGLWEGFQIYYTTDSFFLFFSFYFSYLKTAALHMLKTLIIQGFCTGLAPFPSF
jgi:hypothetical protein